MIRETGCFRQKRIIYAAIVMILFFLMSVRSGVKTYAEDSKESSTESALRISAESSTESSTESSEKLSAEPPAEPSAELSVEDDSTVDFVLVLDNSGTMARSDPDALTTAAAKMFIDMLPEKNARVAVVEFGSDYGDSAYSSEKYTNYVSVPFPLSDITTTDQKEACKKIIGETTQDGEYTPVGYAFQAACDVLMQGGATVGDAGILLISDFRITGQKKEDFLEDGYNYQSLADAEAAAAANQWPVYTLELNFDGKNDNPSDYTERIAARIRSDIPEKVGYGDYVPLTNAEDAQARFAEIFNLFFDPENEEDSQGQTQITDAKGDAVFHFSVGGMVAELNVTLTCEDSSLIKGLEIGCGDALEAYDLSDYSEPIRSQNRTITRDGRYITIKMMVPEPSDDWKVIVHGAPETEIGMYALSIHDMSIQLTASADAIEEGEGFLTVTKGSPVQFKASYIYDGIPYNSSKVYATYPAVLEIKETGEQISMTPGESDYSASIPFDDTGTYTVKAIVNDSTFRTGSIESGEYTVVVQKRMIQLNEDEDFEEGVILKPEENFEVDCSQFFISPDGVPLTYSVTLEPESSELTYVQNGDILKFTAGISASKTGVTITADDGSKASASDPVKKELTVTVTNEPLTIVNDCSGSYEFAWNQSTVPKYLKKLVTQSEQIDQSGNLRFYWADIFSDPDGYTPVITVEETNPNQAIFHVEDDDGIVLRAVRPGEATINIIARDANDQSVEKRVTLHVSSYNARDYVMEKVRAAVRIVLIVLAVLAVLIVALIIRKVISKRKRKK